MDRYIDGNNVVKYAFLALILVYVLAYQNILDVTIKDLAQEDPFILGLSGFSYVIMWLSWWIMSGYQFYLAYGAIRGKKFPSSRAVIPFKSKQVAGKRAYIYTFVVFISALSMSLYSVVWVYEVVANVQVYRELLLEIELNRELINSLDY